MSPDTTSYKYQLVSRDDIIAKIKCLHGANVVDNGDYGKSEKAKTARSYFSFFMPTDEGSKLVAQLISYEGKGNVFIDYGSETKFVDHESLIPYYYSLECEGNDKTGVESLRFKKSHNELKGEAFEKRVGKYYEHLGYEVIYHGFEKGLKDGGIDLIVKKLSEKTKYVQCKNLKKQIDYDKIAGIYGRVVDELKFNVEFVIWANNGFDYGAKKFAEQKGIVLMSGEDLVGVEKEYSIVDVQDGSNNINWLCYDDVGSWSEGLVVVTQQNKQNWINEKGKLLSDIWYDHVGDWEEGYAKIKSNNKQNFINKGGEIFFKSRYDKIDWDWSEGYVRIMIDNRWNWIDRNRHLFSNTWYDEVGNRSEGYARICRDNQYNIIDKNEKEISNERFDSIIYPTDELSVVVKNERYNRINKEGKIIFSEWFDDIMLHRTKDGFNCAKGDDGWGIIKNDGTIVSEMIYDDISPPDPCRPGDSYLYRSDEYAIVIKDNQYNRVSKDGNLFSDIWYDEVGNRSEGYACIKCDGGTWNWIDKDGNLFSDIWYDEIGDRSEGYIGYNIRGERNAKDQYGKNFYETSYQNLFTDGSYPKKEEPYIKFKKFNKYNWFDKDGKVFSDERYDDVGFRSEGYAEIKSDNKWNRINEDKEIISSIWFNRVSEFKEGYAKAFLDNKQNLVNKDGILISKSRYDEVEYNVVSQSKRYGGFVRVKHQGKYNLMDKIGKLVSDTWFDAIRISSYSDQLIFVRQNHKYNFIDTKGKLLSDTWFDYASDFSEGYATVKIEGIGRNFIDTKGKLLF